MREFSFCKFLLLRRIIIILRPTIPKESWVRIGSPINFHNVTYPHLSGCSFPSKGFQFESKPNGSSTDRDSELTFPPRKPHKMFSDPSFSPGKWGYIHPCIVPCELSFSPLVLLAFLDLLRIQYNLLLINCHFFNNIPWSLIVFN